MLSISPPLIRRPPSSHLFPYTTLFRSLVVPGERDMAAAPTEWRAILPASIGPVVERGGTGRWASVDFSNALFERSEEHTSELQSRFDLVCRLLLEKKKKSNRRRLSTCL